MKHLAVIAIAVALVLGVGAAWAKSTSTPVSGLIVAATGTTEKQWVDDDGVLHARGYVGEETLVGDLAGTIYVEASANMSLITGNGDQYGKLRFEGTWKGVSGTFEGSWSGPITGFYFDGEWACQGSGNFAGMKLKVDNYGWLTPPGSPFIPQVYEGYVHDPHGD
ncbi:MAG: hypothetical protein ACYS99_02140 [Planctomycetota bacterium]|jgi:hypothetical protein